jgi:hypothetical protein
MDGATLTVEYSRPRARGRTGIFGTQVKSSEVWTPGANKATTLAVSKDVTIDGHAVPKGKYSVWLAMDSAAWRLVLDPDTTRYHTQRPKPSDKQIRFAVRRETRPFMDALTWWFPEVRTGGVTLAMQWDTVHIPLDVRVKPSYTTAVSADRAAGLVGRYELRWTPQPPRPAPKDTTKKDSAATAAATTAAKPDTAKVAAAKSDTVKPIAVKKDTTPPAPPRKWLLTLNHEGGSLRGLLSRTPPRPTDENQEWMLVHAKGDWYYLGVVLRGELAELSDDMTFQFIVTDGKASGFELRTRDDNLVASGTRLP